MNKNTRYDRCKRLFLVSGYMLIAYISLCQCPENAFFKSTVLSVYNSPQIDNDSQLKQLLNLHRQMKNCRLDRDSVYMFLSQKIGVLYYKKSDLLNAVEFTTASINIAKVCLQNNSTSTLSLVDGYYNLQYYYGVMNKLEKKYDAIDSCIAYSLKDNTGFVKSIPALEDKANYLFNKGEYSSCIRNALLGIDIVQKYGNNTDSMANIVSFTTHLLNALIYSKDTARAENLLNKQIKEFKQTKNTAYLGGVYGFLGSINNDKRNYGGALDYFLKAYHTFQLINYKNGCAQSLASIGILYAKHFNQQDKGLKYCAAALKYADASDSLFILKETGNIHVLKKQYDIAQTFFQRAFNAIQPGMNETNILQNSFLFPGFDILQILLQLITQKADAYVDQYYHTKNKLALTKALGIYKKGDLFLAKIKTEQQLQFSSNLIWRTTARNLYEHAIEACYSDNNIEEAFYFFEKSRAVLLNDQINEQRWMTNDDIAQLAKIKKTVLELEKDLSASPPSSKEYLTINKKLYTSTQELTALIHNIKNKNPLSYQNYLDTDFVSVRQLRKTILNNSKTLVEIFSGDSAVYVLTITPGKQVLTKINKLLYDSLASSFNSFITNRNGLNRNFRAFIKSAHQLNSLLFQNDPPPDGGIVISPDGISYPFEALVMNERELKPDYFLNHYATSYTYSVKYLMNRFALNSTAGNNVLGIAPVQYKNYPNLAELAGSDNSLKTIDDYFSNVTNYTFEKATKRNFLQNFPRYNIIQLYTHAADSSTNNDPVIYFSDSPMFLSELLPDQKPVTQLVVLSACETANGKLYQGEGIFSFNRGFASLGIPAAVSNLWSVDNESTYHITELFYKYLSQEFPTDISLQKAKLEFINSSSSKEKKLPYFWAAPILTGKVDTFKTNAGFSWKWLAAGAVLLLCAGYAAKKYFDQKRKGKTASFSGGHSFFNS